MRKLETEIENEKYLLLKPITYSPDKLKTISNQKRQKTTKKKNKIPEPENFYSNNFLSKN